MNATQDTAYDIYCAFDIEQHKRLYVDYCEVCIDPDGTIQYANPSHTKYLEAFGARQQHMAPVEFAKRCPCDMWADYLSWLVMATGVVCVWSHGYLAPCTMADQQKLSLARLIKAGLTKNEAIYGGRR